MCKAAAECIQSDTVYWAGGRKLGLRASSKQLRKMIYTSIPESADVTRGTWELDGTYRWRAVTRASASAPFPVFPRARPHAAASCMEARGSLSERRWAARQRL